MSSTFRRRVSSAVTSSSSTAGSDISDIRTISSSTIVQRKGTKAWTGGNALTSTGLRDMDSILGGGQPFGTAILLEEDRLTQDSAMALMRYWSAEALAQQHRLLLAASIQQASFNHMHQGFTPLDCAIFLQTMLPRNLNWVKTSSSTEIQSGHGECEPTILTSSKLTTCLEGHDLLESLDLDDFEESSSALPDDDNEDVDEGLRNAWQYKLSIQRERSGQSSSRQHTETLQSSQTSVQARPTRNMKHTDDTYCHSYDLSGNLAHQLSPSVIQELIDTSIIPCHEAYNSNSPAIALFQTWMAPILDQLQQHPSSVIRLLLPNIPMASVTNNALSLTLSFIRHHSLPVVILLTIRSWLHHDTTNLHSLRRTCDAVFSCHGFASLVEPPPPEFRDIQGIFYIRKISSLFPSTTQFNSSSSSHSRRPLTHRMGMKRDRRRLSLHMLHLPPEDYSSGGSTNIRTCSSASTDSKW